MNIDQLEKYRKVLTTEQLQILQKLKVGPLQVAEVFLVASRVKPSTALQLYPWNSGLDYVSSQLAEFGLHLQQISKGFLLETTNILAVLAVSNSSENLQRLVDVLESDFPDHQKYGELLGYPQTAVEAFKADQALEFDVQKNPLGFFMSADNYDAEQQLQDYWLQLVEQNLPEVYEKMMPVGD